MCPPLPDRPPPLQALATQQANRAAQNRLPPLWAVAAMVVLGANEAVAVLRNPLYLVLLLVLFLFLKTIYQARERERAVIVVHQGPLAPGQSQWPDHRRSRARPEQSSEAFCGRRPERRRQVTDSDLFPLRLPLSCRSWMSRERWHVACCLARSACLPSSCPPSSE